MAAWRDLISFLKSKSACFSPSTAAAVLRRYASVRVSCYLWVLQQLRTLLLNKHAIYLVWVPDFSPLILLPSVRAANCTSTRTSMVRTHSSARSRIACLRTTLVSRLICRMQRPRNSHMCWGIEKDIDMFGCARQPWQSPWSSAWTRTSSITSIHCICVYIYCTHTHTHTHTHDPTHSGNDKLQKYATIWYRRNWFQIFTPFIKHVNTLSMRFPTKLNLCKKGVIFAVLTHSCMGWIMHIFLIQ